jgi:aspartyl-tRNA(Asn)/glutamyl-tRNA(Gln) amidotransferase subunit C
MSLTRDEVAKIAHLARLALTDEELDHYGRQLSAVLDYAARLNELDLSDVPPAAPAGRLINVWRDDVVMPSLPTEDALFNAAATAEGQFLIQAVLEE